MVSGEESDFVWLPVEPNSEDPDNEFANRLRKNLKKILKWATREEYILFQGV